MPKSKVRKKAQEKISRERAEKGACADRCCPPLRPHPRQANDDR